MCCGCRFFVSAVPNRRNKKMAESMKGLKRTCRCAEVTKADIGKKVTLMGWVQKSRNKGGIIFVDLRDRSGIMQIIFENGPISEEGFEKAAKLRSFRPSAWIFRSVSLARTPLTACAAASCTATSSRR